MLEDVLAAVATVREQAASFGIDPHRLGVLGSSAGGHLAAHALVAWHTYDSAVSLRPDFGVLCYPVILSSGPHVHAGSMINLAGADATPEQLAALSCDRLVRADTPPCFLWHTGEDTAVPVENSFAFASALRRNGVPFELHAYQQGGHGLGLNTPFDWATEVLRWMRAGWSAQPD
jgi:acetyl esterase/lipase